MFFYLGNKVDVVPEPARSMKNHSKLWHYGYDPEYDIIIISKDGTLGDVFEVSGLKIGLPECPADYQIRNYFLPIEKQKWAREKLPEGINDDNWHEERFEKHVDGQFEKRKNGEWIFLGGKKVWLVGSYWFFLQEYKEGAKYSTLRVIQNELMMFWEACKADERSFGMQYLKNRRFGASALGCNELLDAGTSNADKQLGLISKKGKDAKKIFARLVRAFKRLSPYFKVETDGTATPKTELVFAEQNKRRKIGQAVVDDEGLNTVTQWHNTELNAMDGDEIFRSLIDEGGKWEKNCPFDEYWSVVKTSHTIGMDIVGKSMVVSTVNSRSKGGQEFLNVWNQSDPNDRNDNGQTQSGLYRIFIDAALGLQGFYDQYGFSIIEDPEEPILNDGGKLVKIGADTYLKNRRKNIKDANLLNEEIRQFPRNINEAFRDEAKDCVFNLTKIMEQLDYISEELDEDEHGNTGLTRGNFAWKDGVPDTTVVFHPNPTEGRFWIKNGCHPKIGVGNVKIKKWRNGNLSYAPANEGVGCIGVDPFNRSQTTDGRGSQGAIHGFTIANTVGYPDNDFLFEYIDRPPKIEIFFEDVIMCMIYFSLPILPEMSSDRFSNMLIEREYRNFVMNNPFKKYKDLSPEEKKVGGVNAQSSKIREAQFQAVNTYIEDYVGIARDEHNRKIGEIGPIVFSRTVSQWKDTDPDNRTDYDAYISSSLALVGAKSRFTERKEDVEVRARKIPFRKYDNTGMVSQVI